MSQLRIEILYKYVANEGVNEIIGSTIEIMKN